LGRKRGCAALEMCAYIRISLENASQKPFSVADVHLVSLNPKVEGLIVPTKFYGIAAAGRPTLFIGAPDGEIGRIINDTRCGCGAW
jgi:hypothetical protein